MFIEARIRKVDLLRRFDALKVISVTSASLPRTMTASPLAPSVPVMAYQGISNHQILVVGTGRCQRRRGHRLAAMQSDRDHFQSRSAEQVNLLIRASDETFTIWYDAVEFRPLATVDSPEKLSYRRSTQSLSAFQNAGSEVISVERHSILLHVPP